MRWEPNGSVMVGREKAGEGNGCTLDRQGRLIMCDGADHRRIRALDAASDGALSNNRVFCDMSSAEPGVPDGMKVDTKGRVFCVGSGGIWVIAPSGEVIGIARMPAVVRNLAF